MDDTTKKLIEGIITPMITSVSDRKHIDFDGQGRLLDRIVAGGVNGAFILGTTGEGCSLSERMKQELIEFTVSHARGRVPVFVHIADCCLENSIALASFAERKNADYLVCALPFYFGLTQEEIYRYYIALADNVALPLFLYNIPAQTKMMISAGTVKRLAAHPNIIGIKDSSGNGTYFNTLLSEVKGKYPDFSILVGPDEMLASTMGTGGNGGVNSGSNLFPELFSALFKACKENDRKRIIGLQKIVMHVSSGIYSVDSSPMSFLKGLKTALYLEGMVSDCMCEPLGKVSGADIETIRENLSAVKKEIAETV